MDVQIIQNVDTLKMYNIKINTKTNTKNNLEVLDESACI